MRCLYGRESTELVSSWYVFQFYFALYLHVLYFCFSFHRLSRRNLCLSPTQPDEILGEENGNNSDIVPIEVAIDAGATLSKPAGASISRKRKIHVNEGKYKEQESGTSTSSSGKGNTTCAWDCVKGYPKQHFAVVSGSLRCNACSETLSLQKSSIDKHIKSG